MQWSIYECGLIPTRVPLLVLLFYTPDDMFPTYHDICQRCYCSYMQFCNFCLFVCVVWSMCSSEYDVVYGVYVNKNENVCIWTSDIMCETV